MSPPRNPLVALQYVLPHRLLSRAACALARWQWRPWKNFFIGRIVAHFKPAMEEAVESDPFAYPSFNAFFTRALKPDARPIDADPNAVVMPSDGRISQLGRIEQGRIFQAKGQSFTAAELLGDEAAAVPYADGHFFNVYLAPRDYHRVHMPMRGTLRDTVHVPGRLFSVSPATARAVPRLFARNERLVCHFDGEHGPFCVVMVGAMLVSGVETVWNGVDIPPYAHTPIRRDWRGKGIRLERGAEMARFNYGSTVIVLWPKGAIEFDPSLAMEQPTRMGQRLGRTMS
ncbi:MAG: archaetidylserine decarboxylase [Chiayiivirga sp.]|jgi:phosphatidylserine decarboxylase|uniref:archaetidylserine decarboxylase n=1 Tax=Chiayiivirga sp. TaxID=2041042 RepID=UPI0025BD8EDD|nr:archaetidylserine decarboxylase [Chiayiivirga sp.]MCI1709335.1 archaetidylserine decarboxylase [Chiayiivirga sp.]MCI1730736.1 archaetidylserine decarboxylase [Chiayiivirga sp.]